MAYIVGKLIEDQSSGASFTPNFSNIIWDSTLATADKAILAGDMILTGLANRQPVGTSFSTPAGYTKIGTYGRQSNQAHIWFYLKAAGGETGPAYTVESAECIGITLIVRGVDPTTQITASSARKDWVNSASFASDTPTAAAGDLVIYSCSCNNTTQFPRAKLSQLTGLARYDGANVALAVGYKQVESAGSVSAVTWYNKAATNGGNAWVICIKTASSAAVQPDIRTSINELNWYGLHGSANTLVPTTNAWQKPSTFATGALGTLNGINLSTIALGTVTTSAQPFGTALGSFSGIPHATSETAWAGAWHTQASIDLRGSLVSVQWEHDIISTNANVGADGIILVLSDGTNWVAYQLASKAKGWGAVTPETAVVAVGNATAYASSGTISTTLSAVTQIGYFWHRAAGVATSFSLYVRNLLVIPTTLSTTPGYSASLTGGGSARPANPSDFYAGVTSWEFQALATRQADGQIMSRIDICFGDGTNATYVDASAYPVSFPQAWSASDSGNWQMGWNVATLAVSIAVKTKSTDTVNLIADAFVAPNKQLMVIDSGANTGAAVSIAGSSVVGMTFTDNAGFALTSGTFQNGGTVTLKANATSLNVSKTVGAVPAVAMTANNKTIATSTIDVTGTSATYHLSLAAAVAAITLNGVTFTGTPATDKIYSALASGTLTITTDGTGTALVAGDVTFVGGSTAVAVIAAPQVYQKVTVSGFTAGSRIQIYDTTSATELFNGTASAGNTVVSGSSCVWTDPVAAAADRAIRVRVAYINGTSAEQWQQLSGLTCGQTGTTEEITYPVTPIDDDTYNSNAINGPAIYATSGITFTDAATDLVNISIAGGTVTWQTIYACFVYWLSTAAGIDDDVAYIDAPDPANYLLTSMKIKNTHANPLTITGGYGRSATTGLVADIIDTAGSTGNIFPSPDHVVAYATGSGALTAGDITNIWSNATRTLSATADANIVQVAGSTITGAGTEANPWGP